MISQIIRVSTKPQKRREMLQTLQSLSPDVRQVKGCLQHFIYEDVENDNVFAVYDEWETEEDFNHYLTSDLYGVFRASMSLLSDSNHRQVGENNKMSRDSIEAIEQGKLKK